MVTDDPDRAGQGSVPLTVYCECSLSGLRREPAERRRWDVERVRSTRLANVPGATYRRVGREPRAHREPRREHAESSRWLAYACIACNTRAALDDQAPLAEEAITRQIEAMEPAPGVTEHRETTGPIAQDLGPWVVSTSSGRLARPTRGNSAAAHGVDRVAHTGRHIA